MPENRESREREFIDLLRKEMEAELKWGPVQQWTQRDFQNLSQLVEAKTREHLGVTTLKRILGRVSHKGLPYLQTLNILAVFLGYENWIGFKKKSAGAFETQDSASATPELGLMPEEFPDRSSEKKGGWKKKAASFATPVLVFCSLFFLGASLWLWNENRTLKSSGSRSSGKPVVGHLKSEDAISDTFPHLVHFNFYCPDLDPNQLNVISFEPAYMQYMVTDSQGVGSVSHLYTRPGFYNVKVFSNKQTVAQKAVLISSGGWKGTVQGKDKFHKPLALKREGGVLKADKASLAAALKDTTRRFHTSFYFYKEMGVSGEFCTVKVRLRNPTASPLNHDRGITIRLWGENDYHMVQMANPFRPFELFNRFGDLILDSARTPPEQEKKFIRETKDWFDFELRVKDKHVQLFYNHEPILDDHYTVPIGSLMGVEALFVGTGELDYFHVYDHEGNPVLMEDF